MADEKLNTGPAENISPEAAEPIATSKQAAAFEPQQECSYTVKKQGPVDKSKNSAGTHSSSSRTVNLKIAKDGIYHPLEV